MARQLTHGFHGKKLDASFEVSQEDWNELKKEVLDIRLQLKNAQGGLSFLHSKLVQMMDRVREDLNHLTKKQHQFEDSIFKKLSDIQIEFENYKNNQEGFMTNRVKELLEQHQQLDRKYKYELQDLCQSLTEHSEQVWSLTDQLQEIKEGLRSPPS